MQRNTDLHALPFPLSPFLLLNAVGGVGDLGEGGFELSRYLFLGSLLFSREGGGMDLSKVGEKILSSVRSARSLGLLPSPSDRPEVPARAAAAAAVARVLAGLPPHQRHALSSSSEELSSIYGCRPQAVDKLEEEFFKEELDPVRYILEQIPSEEIEPSYFEEKATLRLAQLDKISERLSRHVMEHHEEMVKGMHLVRELEKDLKIANVICMNGRRHLTSSRNEISRDLIVTTNSKKKQTLLDLLPVLTEISHAVDMQEALETLVEEGNFSKAFQILSEYLQLLDSLSGLSVVKDMTSGVEVWLGKTLQKLDSLLLNVCQDFKEDDYITVIDAYALIGDVSGLAEKIQSVFMQEALTESHSTLRVIMQEDVEDSCMQNMRLTYSDLCLRIPESKFRQCLLATLSILFKQMCAYYLIMSLQLEENVSFCYMLSSFLHSFDLLC
ncbi:coiled-coil domain-containing protein 132 [Dorcoceras hygrometricum]|uniref:Coiled-coil domain-containing protein 132 n=1 Tax=Dorcoceras hygrometricum TaxID=472368 RepID=A0A2Z7CMM0_9LAMI|nr:coiled-coil domain-containing protein 132 [Dorcoceras hygrometricum]